MDPKITLSHAMLTAYKAIKESGIKSHWTVMEMKCIQVIMIFLGNVDLNLACFLKINSIYKNLNTGIKISCLMNLVVKLT